MGTARIAGVEFEVVRRGLHPDEVAAALNQVLHERDDLRVRVHSLDALLTETQAALVAAREQEATPLAAVQAEAADIRAAATADAGAIMQQALRVRLDADQQAREIRERAEAGVISLRAEAERALTAADAARADAEREAEAIRASARRDADQMRAAADSDARELLESATREAAADAARLASEAQEHLGVLCRDLTAQLTTLAREARAVSGSDDHPEVIPSSRGALARPPSHQHAVPPKMPGASPRIAALVGDAPDDMPRHAPAAASPHGGHSALVATESEAVAARRSTIPTAAVRPRGTTTPEPDAPPLPKRTPGQTGPIVVRTLDSVLEHAHDGAGPS